MMWKRTLTGLIFLSLLLAGLVPTLSAQSAAPVQYVYDDLGRLTKVVDQNGNVATYNYDAVGNLTGDGTNTYTWNERNQLVTISGAVSATFQYDPFGRRVSKTIGGTTQYLYDGANPVQEISGTTASANLLSGGLDEYFQRTDAAGARSFLTDALGSTVALADSSGALQTQYTFEPFGNTSTTGATSTNSFAYTGRELDATGLYYYRAKYYNPQLQRFISEDPIGFRGGINKYRYVGNRPTGYVDPRGLDRKSPTNSPPSCRDGETPVSVDPFTNTVVQAGGNYGVANGSLSYVPSTADIYGTAAVGNPGIGAFVGAGPTTNLDQSGPTVGISGFAGLGGGVSGNPMTGDTTDLYGLGTPGLPTVSGGYTKRLGGVPPAIATVCVLAIEPSRAIPIGDGLYMSDDYGPPQ